MCVAAAHYAGDSYVPIDQVKVMENSRQSIGRLTQNTLPEEAKCSFIHRQLERGFFHMVFGGSGGKPPSPCVSTQIHRGNIFHDLNVNQTPQVWGHLGGVNKQRSCDPLTLIWKLPHNKLMKAFG